MNNKIDKRSVIFGATCFADANSTIQLAVTLATEVGSELRAILVEDETVIEFSSQPYARAISHLGKSAAVISPDAMREAYRRDAGRFKDALANAGFSIPNAWSFEQLKGTLGPTLLETANTGDLLIFGHQSLSSAKSGVIVIEAAGSPDQSIAMLAKSVSEKIGQMVETYSLEGRNRPHQGEELDRPRSGFFGVQKLLDHLNIRSPSCVFVSAGIADDIGIDELLSASRCPLIISLK